MAVLPDQVAVDGKRFDLVCRRKTGVAIYRGNGTFLRLGNGVDAELAVHRQMEAWGYPVAEVLAIGELRGSPYYVEVSLGPQTLGEAYAEQLKARGRVQDAEFSLFADLMLRLARAQLRAGRGTWRSTDFAQFLGVAAAAANLPALADSIRTAFKRADSALSSLPGCFQHGDLHPDNACPSGIIDLEESGWAAAGYDVSTAVFEPSLHEGRWRNGTLAAALFTAQQTRHYLDLLDEEFRGASVPPPSANIDAFIICRAIGMCAVVHRERAVWERKQRTLEGLLTAYLDDHRLPLE